MSSFHFPKGSEWRKWDLHAHTPLDFEWISRPPLSTDEEKKHFATSYIERARVSGLSALAITDHNFCEHTDHLLIEHIQTEGADKGITVFPGFEVTVSDCGGTHVLVIFPEQTPLLTIDDIVKQLFPPGTNRFRERNVMPSNRDIDDLNMILQDSGLDSITVFAHADSDHGALNHRGGDLRARLWQKPFVNIAQVSKSLRECGPFYESICDGTNGAYSRPMTYVVCSDCRAIERNGLPADRNALGDRFTWIKADPTFEGLRQIIFEGSSRVAIQDHKPEQKSELYTISSIQFISEDKNFQTEPIPINPNLVTIIGGKSTGKSLLLAHLAKATDFSEFQEKTRIAKVNDYHFDNINVMVGWSNGDVSFLGDSEAHHRITYIPQMYIHRLVENENRKSLSGSILNFLLQNKEFNNEYHTIRTKADESIAVIGSNVIQLMSISNTWRQVSIQMKELGEKKALQTECKRIEDNQNQLRISSGFSTDELCEYNALLTNQNDANNRLIQLNKLNEFGASLIQQVYSSTVNLISQAEEVKNDLVVRHGIDPVDAAPYLSTLGTLIEGFGHILDAFKQGISQLLGMNIHQINQISTSINDIQKNLQPYLGKISNKKQLEELETQLSQINQTLTSLIQKESESTAIANSYRDMYSNINKQMAEHLSLMLNIFDLINRPDFTNIGDGIKICGSLDFDMNRFESQFISKFDLRSPLSRLGVYFAGESFNWSLETHIEAIMDIFNKLITLSADDLRLKSGNKLEDAINSLFQDYLVFNFSVIQNEESILSMSPGKQGLVLLELFLHLNNSLYPILIDQPEDNLDNRTIYSHLVKYIKEKKCQRQIIMVTHNPNLVVATDAEQVIVANQSGQGGDENQEFRFEYVSGSLECSFEEPSYGILTSQGIREHVCQLLEGGAEAFKKREEKYCLK